MPPSSRLSNGVFHPLTIEEFGLLLESTARTRRKQ
jgi:hypothetical protein